MCARSHQRLTGGGHFSTPSWQLFNDGRFVPKANSYQKQAMEPWASWQLHGAGHWAATVREAARIEESFAAANASASTMTVRFEDLMTDRVSTMARVLEFLGTQR